MLTAFDTGDNESHGKRTRSESLPVQVPHSESRNEATKDDDDVSSKSGSIMELSSASRSDGIDEENPLLLRFPLYMEEHHLVTASEGMVEFSGHLLNVEGAQVNPRPVPREYFLHTVRLNQWELDRLKLGIF